jgi:hypothetical protein
MEKVKCAKNDRKATLASGRRTLLGAAVAASAAVTSLSTTDATAWVNGSGTCPFGTSDAYWTAGTRAMKRCTNKSFPGFPNSPLPPAERNLASAQSAMAWAHWMWYRSGSTNMYLWLDQVNPNNCESGDSWIDNGNEINEEWYVPNDPCDDNAMACEFTDHADCFTSGNNRTLASDIVINSANNWEIVLQNNLLRCLTVSERQLQNTAMHELGHSYGLKHHNSYPSLMNDQKPRVKNCDVAAGFHDYPMPDDFQGFLQYHKSYSGARFNLAGTPFYRASNGRGTFDSVGKFISSSSQYASWTVSFTYHSYFAHSGPNVPIIFRFIREGTIPTFNYSTNTWSNLGNLISYWQVDAQVNGWFSKKVTVFMDVFHWELPTGNWRVWAQIDDLNNLGEVDKGDNLFPLDVFITRGL